MLERQENRPIASPNASHTKDDSKVPSPTPTKELVRGAPSTDLGLPPEVLIPLPAPPTTPVPPPSITEAQPPATTSTHSSPTLGTTTQSNKSRMGATAASCLPAIICGIAVTENSVTFSRGVTLWLAFVVAAGLILRYPDKDQWDEAGKRAAPAAFLFGLSIALVLFVKLLFGVLALESHVSLEQNQPPPRESRGSMGGAIPVPAELVNGVINVTKVVATVILLFVMVVSTILAVALTSVGSELIFEGVKRFITFDPDRLRRADELVKLLIALVVSVFLLWRTLLE